MPPQKDLGMLEVSPGHKRQKGQTAEFMREMTRRRMEMAKTDPSKKGGRPKTRYTKAETEQAALERLKPVALKVLETQLESKDERVAQRAAQLLLEWKLGKPGQTIKQETSNVTKIVYESAAWHPELLQGGMADASGQ